MASADAFLAHVVSRMQADIDFLVEQGVISRSDGRLMSAKLPASQQAPMMPTPMVSPSPTPTAAPAPSRRGVPPPPTLPQVSQARSLWPYNENGQEPSDLSFGAQETIEILEETNADWWKGKNSRGETGLFPANYVERLPPAPAGVSASSRMVAPMPSEKASYNPMPVVPAELQQQQDAQPPKKNKFGKYGNTMAQSAAGGVGFGAGAAIGSGIVNAIF